MGEMVINDRIVHVQSLDPEFCAWLAARLKATAFQVRVPSPGDEAQPQWAATTGYGETFRAIVIDGRDTAAGVPAELLDAAREVSGRPEAVAFRAQANLMLPGQGLGRHTDVPEFRGARRWQFPDWLLVAMLHSGRYHDRRLEVISALLWPAATSGGDLRVFDGDDRELLASFPPEPGAAVAFDTCLLPHDVDRVPGREVRVGYGDRIAATGDGRWCLARVGASTVTLARDEVRASVLVKVAVFADEADRDSWFAGPDADDPLDQEQVIAELAAGIPGGVDGHQELVDHFVPYR